MSEQLLSTMGVVFCALISALATVMVALINSARKHAKATREQTENSHGNDPEKIANLRDNIDVNQTALVEKLDVILVTQIKQSDKIDRLFSITNGHTNQIDEITREKVEIERARRNP